MNWLPLAAVLLLAGCTQAVDPDAGADDAVIDAAAAGPAMESMALEFDDCRTLRMFIDLDRAKATAALPDGFTLYNNDSATAGPTASADLHVYRCTGLDGTAAPTHFALASVAVHPPAYRFDPDFPYDEYRFDTFADARLAPILAAHGLSVTEAAIDVTAGPGGYTFAIEAPGVAWNGVMATAILPDQEGSIFPPFAARWHHVDPAGHQYVDITEGSRSINGLTPNYNARLATLEGGALPTMRPDVATDDVDNAMDWSGPTTLRIRYVVNETTTA